MMGWRRSGDSKLQTEDSNWKRGDSLPILISLPSMIFLEVKPTRQSEIEG